jgi:hypothetical protein
MIPYLIALIVLSALAAVGLYVGVIIARVVRDQFDELLPQRMVDYSGFVKPHVAKD